MYAAACTPTVACLCTHQQFTYTPTRPHIKSSHCGVWSSILTVACAGSCASNLVNLVHCSIARRHAWCNVCSSLDSPSPPANLPPLPDPLVYLLLYSSMRLVQKHVHCCSRRWLAHFCLVTARSAPLLINWNVLHRSICDIDSIFGSVY